MAEDQFQASGNWWENPAIRNNWQHHQQQDESNHMMKPARVSMDSSGGGDGGVGGGSSSVVFHDPQKLQPPDSAAAATSSTDPNLHFMALGLSSPPIDWNQQPSFLRGEKGGENSFRSMLQEEGGGGGGMGLSPQQVHQWRSPETEFKNNRGFCLEQNQFSPQYSSGDSTVTSQQGFHHQNMDHSAVLYGSPSSILQGLLGPDHHHQQQANHNFSYPTSNYGLSSSSSNEFVPTSSSSNWSNNNNNKVPQFLRGSPPKQLSNSSSSAITTTNTSLHFTNNAPFWNAAAAASDPKDVRSTTFFPNSLQPPFFTNPSFDVQSKNMSEMRDSGAVVKKSGSEPTPKRPRNETTPSPLPAFKVRKEKMGDRITALQQLVSPFGKTDTASVLSEAIEYIKFLHEQVTVLSTPYMKSGAPIQIQQSSGKSKEGEGPKQDLRSRGLCLVPVSSTFPMTHETTVEFWTPTFGGGSR